MNRRMLLTSCPLFAILVSISVAADEPTSATAHVLLIDGGKIQLVIEHKKFDLETPYGKLQIPVEEIQGIELASRVPENMEKEIDEKIGLLASPQFEIRERATNELRKLGAKAYPAIVRIAERNEIGDLEVKERLENLLNDIEDTLPENAKEIRDEDIVYTAKSKIAGKLKINTIPAVSSQFGKVELKLSDVRDLQFSDGFSNDELLAKAEPAPHNLSDGTREIGKTYLFRITGDAGGAGSVWGTDVYTADSALATAAVHSGAIKAGATGLIRVKIMGEHSGFVGSSRNGVTSYDYPAYPTSYKIMKVR